MRGVTRDAWSLALLCLVYSNSCIAHGTSKGSEQDSNAIQSSSTSLASNDGSGTTEIALITSTTTVNATTTITSIGPGYPGTCRSGTLNHITHSLPQQCPTSAWTAPSARTTIITNVSDGMAGGDEVSDVQQFISSSVNSSTASEHSTQFEDATGIATESPEPTPLGLEGSETADIGTSSFSSTSSTAFSLSSSPSLPPSPSSSPSSSSVFPDATSAESDPELETDSPLDNANFLSFEEWKKQNLEKAGQSPDGGQNIVVEGQARQRPDIALDALGDEGEIELDFSGFGRNRFQEEEKSPPEDKPKVSESGVASNGPVLRSKDAGKTCKERSNYASFDCAATILKTNPETKSSSAILIENKDSYMLNPCSVSNKFIIIELCDDILIDTIVLANYEFFSSIFRTFRVSVSDRYPVKADKWKELGVFEASNSRSVQAFLVPHSLIWARYLRIEFLTHFGTEYYCPVSLLRVHGTTMMEEFRHQEYINRGENLDDSEDEAAPLDDEASNEPSSVAQEPPTVSIEADKSVLEEPITPSAIPIEAVMGTEALDTGSASSATPSSANIETGPGLASDSVDGNTPVVPPSSVGSPSRVAPIPTSGANHETLTGSTSDIEAASSRMSSALVTQSNPPKDNSTTTPASLSINSSTATSVNGPITTMSEDAAHGTEDSTSTIVHSADSSLPNSSPFAPSPVGASTLNETHSDNSSTNTSSSVASSTSATAVQQSSSGTQNNTSSTSSQQSNPRSSSTSALSASPPNPTTQESFFKSIHKRLQMLESNATLSLQYIESQSILLRTAFQAVEKRQLKKTETFLANLNSTVTTELDKFKGDYERLWEGVVIEMETQRRQSEREVLMISERMQVMAEELIWQKRVGVVQSTLLLLCLGLVMFARSGFGANSGLEVPLLQQLSRSKWGSQRIPSAYFANDRMSPTLSPSPTSPIADGEVLSAQPQDSRSEAWNVRRRRRVFGDGDHDTNNRSGVESLNGDVSEGTDSRPGTRDGSATVSSIGSGTSNHNTSPAGIESVNGARLVSSTSLLAPSDALHDTYYEDTMDMTDEPGSATPTRSDRTIEEQDEGMAVEEQDEEEENVLMPMETRSSPSTPGGTRDQQGLVIAREEAMPIWPIEETDGGN